MSMAGQLLLKARQLKKVEVTDLESGGGHLMTFHLHAAHAIMTYQERRTQFVVCLCTTTSNQHEGLGGLA